MRWETLSSQKKGENRGDSSGSVVRSQKHLVIHASECSRSKLHENMLADFGRNAQHVAELKWILLDPS